MVTNIFDNLPEAKIPDEISDMLCQGQSFSLKRIISTGHTAPEEGWFDQAENEWVILLKGNAKIAFENSSQEVTLLPGDYLFIPARTKHKVTFTTPNEATVWLALHFTKSSMASRFLYKKAT